MPHDKGYLEKKTKGNTRQGKRIKELEGDIDAIYGSGYTPASYGSENSMRDKKKKKEKK